MPVGNRGSSQPVWDERQEYRRVEEAQPDDRLPMTVERIMELVKTLPARDTPQEREDYLAAIERMMRRLVASAELTNRCGCNYWTTPTCPARNCPWQGKRPVDRGLPATPVVDQKAAEGSDKALTHRHIKSGGLYREVARGFLQTAVPLEDLCELVAYVGADGRMWFRPPSEFDDDERFAVLPGGAKETDRD